MVNVIIFNILAWNSPLHILIVVNTAMSNVQNLCCHTYVALIVSYIVTNSDKHNGQFQIFI